MKGAWRPTLTCTAGALFATGCVLTSSARMHVLGGGQTNGTGLVLIYLTGGTTTPMTTGVSNVGTGTSTNTIFGVSNTSVGTSAGMMPMGNSFPFY
jgi:hypothetical protein